MAKDLKPGDLVTLSAAGRNTGWCSFVGDRIGLVTEKQETPATRPGRRKHIAYLMHWTPTFARRYGWLADCPFPRYVLKHARGQNKPKTNKLEEHTND